MQHSLESKDMHKKMLRLRMVEEKVRSEYKSGLMRTPVHLGIGQEAVAVGVTHARQLSDPVLTHHRSHNAYLASGGNLHSLFAELQGKATGCSGGRGGSVHLIDRKVNFYGSSAILSQIIAIATGVAFGNFYLANRNVVIVFFGDAGFEEGTAWESFNFSAIHKLPILYVCENNLYSTESNLESRTAAHTSFIQKVKSFGIQSFQVDGNDVLEVYEKSTELIKLARTSGPQLLECLTYRTLEHVGPFTDKEQKRKYRSDTEVQSWVDKCPIKNMEDRLLAYGQISKEEIEQIRSELDFEISSNWNLAYSDLFPNSSSIFKNLYANT